MITAPGALLLLTLYFRRILKQADGIRFYHSEEFFQMLEQ